VKLTKCFTNVKSDALHIAFTHVMLHRHTLVSKVLALPSILA